MNHLCERFHDHLNGEITGSWRATGLGNILHHNLACTNSLILACRYIHVWILSAKTCPKLRSGENIRNMWTACHSERDDTAHSCTMLERDYDLEAFCDFAVVVCKSARSFISSSRAIVLKLFCRNTEKRVSMCCLQAKSQTCKLANLGKDICYLCE